MLSNRSNTSRLIKQLQHEARENFKDRIHAVRKEIYTAAAAEMTGAMSYLGSIPSLNPAEKNIADGMIPFSKEAAKLQVVAETETALAMNNLVALYTSTFLEFLRLAEPAHSAKADIAMANEFYQNQIAESQRAYAEIQRRRETGSSDATSEEAIWDSHKRAVDLSQKYGADRAAAWNRFNAAYLNYVQALIPKMPNLQAKQHALLVMMRRDLALDSDTDAMLENISEQWDSVRSELENLLAYLKNQSSDEESRNAAPLKKNDNS